MAEGSKELTPNDEQSPTAQAPVLSTEGPHKSFLEKLFEKLKPIAPASDKLMEAREKASKESSMPPTPQTGTTS